MIEMMIQDGTIDRDISRESSGQKHYLYRCVSHAMIPWP